MALPKLNFILSELEDGVLNLTFNRPEARNAMSTALLDDLCRAFDSIRDDRSIRAVVLRGSGGNFCAGGDIRDMAKARSTPATDTEDPVAIYSRRFGAMLRHVNFAPQAVIAILEGAVLGGGFGLACVSDIAIAHADAKFGLPETGLGLPPAQIAPFVVERIGITEARRLGVCGGRFDGHEAKRIGLVHFVADDEAEIQSTLSSTIAQVRRCAPGANAATKRIMHASRSTDMDQLLDDAAQIFSESVRSPEGVEGTTAFIEKRRPTWAVTDSDNVK